MMKQLQLELASISTSKLQVLNLKSKSYLYPSGDMDLRSSFNGVQWSDVVLKWCSFVPISAFESVEIGCFDTPFDAAFAYNEIMVKFLRRRDSLNRLNPMETQLLNRPLIMDETENFARKRIHFF
jgi:hypothetical protein